MLGEATSGSKGGKGAKTSDLVEAPRDFPAYGKARRFQAGRFFGDMGAERLVAFLGGHGGK